MITEAQSNKVPIELQILDALGVPIFAKNQHGIYVYCNQKFSDTLHLSKERILGRNVFEISPVSLAKSYLDADRELFAAGGEQTYTSIIKTAEDHKIVQFDKKIIQVEDNAFIVGAIRQINKQPSPLLSTLSDREAEVVLLILRGLATKEIARALGISPYTVNDHLKSIYRKLDVHTKTQVVQKVLGSDAFVRP